MWIQLRFFSNGHNDLGINYNHNLIRSKISAISVPRFIMSIEQQQAFVITIFLENQLFINASSQNEYINWEILMQQLER